MGERNIQWTPAGMVGLGPSCSTVGAEDQMAYGMWLFYNSIPDTTPPR